MITEAHSGRHHVAQENKANLTVGHVASVLSDTAHGAEPRVRSDPPPPSDHERTSAEATLKSILCGN